MKNFMIGMHGKFDTGKFHRDFRDSFYGIEACLFEDERDIEIIKTPHYSNESCGVFTS